MVMFKKNNESADNDIAKLEDVAEADSIRKPSWVNLTQLEAAASDSVLNKLVFKPALRFHGLTGGFLGQGATPSIGTDSRPPSYRFSVSGNSTKLNEPCSTCDQGSVFDPNVSAVSPLTLRRRNTIAVVLIAIALLATIGAITGIVLYYMQPKEMLRANVYFTIANRNYTDDMLNSTSADFQSISNPLCAEMDLYFLTSELAEFYLRCNVVSLKQNNTKPGLAVQFTLDFDENKATNDGDRIRNIILKKSGRYESEDTLYLVIKKFLVYLKSLRVELEVKPKPDDTGYRPRIPWREDVDFIARKSDTVLEESFSVVANTLLNTISTPAIRVHNVPKTVLADTNTRVEHMLFPSTYNLPVATPVKALHDSASSMFELSVMGQSVSIPKAEFIGNGVNKWRIIPTKASKFLKEEKPSLNTDAVRKKDAENAIINHFKAVSIGLESFTHSLDQDSLLSNVWENEIELKNLAVDKDEIKNVFGIPNIYMDPKVTMNTIRVNQVLDNTYTSSSTSNRNDKQNAIPTGVGNAEKVLTVFTDVFVILGTDAQKQAQTKPSSASETETIYNELLPVNREIVTESDFILPQPSFKTIIDSLIMQTVLTSGSIATASTYTGKSSLTEKKQPKTFTMSPKPVVKTKKRKLNLGRKLFKKPEVIIIHTTRTQTHQKPNFPAKSVPPDKRRRVIPVEPPIRNSNQIPDLPDISVDEINDRPKLFEMQEVTFPPIPTGNQISDIHWFNVLNVPSVLERGQVQNISPQYPPLKNDRATNQRQEENLVERGPTAVTAAREKARQNIENTIDESIGREDVFINDLNSLDKENHFFRRKPVPRREKVYIQNAYPEDTAVGGNIVLAKDNITWHNVLPVDKMARQNIQGINRVAANAYPVDKFDTGNDQTSQINAFVRRIINPEQKSTTDINQGKEFVGESYPPVIDNIKQSTHPVVQSIYRTPWRATSKPDTNLINNFIGKNSDPKDGPNVQNTFLSNNPDREIIFHKEEQAVKSNYPIDNVGGGNEFLQSETSGSSNNQISSGDLINAAPEGVTGFPVFVSRSNLKTKQNRENKILRPEMYGNSKDKNRNTIDKVAEGHTGYPMILSNPGMSVKTIQSRTPKVNVRLRPAVPTGYPIFLSDPGTNVKTIQNRTPKFLSDPGTNVKTIQNRTPKINVRLHPAVYRQNVPATDNRIGNTKAVSKVTRQQFIPSGRIATSDAGVTQSLWTPAIYKSNYVQPWSFLLQQGITSFGRGSTTRNYQNAVQNPEFNRYRTQLIYFNSGSLRRRQTLQYIHSSGRNSRNNYGTSHPSHQRQNRRPVIYYRQGSAYPYGRINFNQRLRAPNKSYYDSRCLPAYPNFTDIIEMQKVLQQLVESLFGMTNKINRMQNAIDYINNTFHERNESLKSVANTLSAMTNSLNNFNANLNDINTTLNEFKDFLKYLNNSMFNIDDVIKYLDDSVYNLDATVSHLDESVRDMNGTLSGINDHTEDVNNSLKMINETVLDVRDTTLSTNITLESMNMTLQKLSDIISSFGIKLDEVIYGLKGINISLRSINDSVHNSYTRLGKLGQKIVFMNDTIQNINSTVIRLNSVYERIDESLSKMNESFDFLNGTILEELVDLSVLNVTLGNVTSNVNLIDSSQMLMNKSLTDAMEWMTSMMEVLNSLNMSVDRQNDSLLISLEDKPLLDTLNYLLSMNSSLSSTSRKVDAVNGNLTEMEIKINTLEDSLQNIENSLTGMNITLMSLQQMLKTVNQTINDISDPLNSINSSLNKLRRNTDDIDVSIENVKQTLYSANKSIDSIDNFVSYALGSSQSINETVIHIEINSDLLTESVEAFMPDLVPLSGSLPELHQKVFNDKETVNIIKEEASILNDSMEIVDDKISDLQTTYAQIKIKLNETGKVLERSEMNLSDIQATVEDVNQTLISLMETLTDIEESLTDVNLGFSSISSAFPNIRKQIRSVITRTRQLKNSSNIVSQDLQKNNIDLTDVLSLASDVNEEYKLLNQRIEHLSKHMDKIELSGVTASGKLKELFDLVKTAEEIVKENSRKVNLINSSFDSLANRYKNLTAKTKETNMSFNKSESSLAIMDISLQNFDILLSKYPKVNITLEGDIKNLTKVKQNIYHANDTFLQSSMHFSSKNNSVWNKDGNPKMENVSFEALQKGINTLNSTMDKHSKTLKEAQLALDNADAFSQYLDDKFDRINKTIVHLDSKKHKTEQIDKSLSALKGLYDEKTDQLNQMIDTVTHLLRGLNHLENEYGNINGSFSDTNTYSNIRNSLLDDLHDLNLQKERAENESLLLSTVKRNYTDKLSNFDSLAIGIDEESESSIFELLSGLNKTLTDIDELDKAFKKLNNSVSFIDKSLAENEEDIQLLENLLQDQMLKNNYVTVKSKKLKEEFDKLSLSLNGTLDTIQKRNMTAINLMKTVVSLTEKANISPNLNFNFDNETDILNKATNMLQNIRLQVQDISSLMKEMQEDSESFITENSGIDDIKLLFDEFFKTLNRLNMDIEQFEEQMTDMNTDFESIKAVLFKTSDVLNQYEKSFQSLDETSNELKNVHKDILNIQINLISAVDKLTNVDSYFRKIENKYKNVSGTAPKTSALYIKDLLTEKHIKLNKTIESLNNVSQLYDGTLTLYQNSNNSFRNTVHTRQNIHANILILNASLEDIQNETVLMADALDRLNADIYNINISLHDMDDVLHERNEELFIKRQKQLYISEKLPNLHDLFDYVNKSLQDANQENILLFMNTESLSEMIDKATALQNAVTNLNIPLDTAELQLIYAQNHTTETRPVLVDLRNTLEQISVNILNENTEDLFKNHSFESTKDIVEETLKNLKNLSLILDKINVDTDINKSNMNSQHAFLKNVTNLIEEFNSLNVISQNNRAQWVPIEKRSQIINQMVDGIKDNFEESFQFLSHVEEEFKDIDAGILNATLFQPKQVFEDVRQLLWNLVDDHTLISKLETETLVALNMTDDKLAERIVSVQNLNRIINEIALEHNQTQGRMDRVHNELDKVNQTMMTLESNLRKLREKLTFAEIKFKEQRKIDFVKSNLPVLQELQSTLENRIGNTSDTLAYIATLYDTISSSFDSSKSLIDEQSKLRLSMNDSELKLEEVNDLLVSEPMKLLDIEKQNYQLLTNLTDHIILANMSNVSLDDLKETFKFFNNSLILLENGISEIDKNNQNMFDKLNDVQNASEKAKKVINAANIINTRTEDIISTWDFYNEKYANLLGSVLGMKSNLTNITYSLDELKQTHPHILDKDLHKRLQLAQERTRELFQDLANISKTLENMEETKNITDKNTNVLNKLKSAKVSSLDQLNRDVMQMKALASLIETKITNLQQKLNVSGAQVNLLSKNISNLQNVTDKLKQDFIKQEKLEYLESISPILIKKHKNIKKRLRYSNDSILETERYVIDAEGTLMYLKDRLNQTDKIDISVAKIANHYNQALVELNESLNTLGTDRHNLNILDIYNILSNSSLIDDTLSNLKYLVANVNETLDTISDSVNHTDENVRTISNEVDLRNVEVLDVLNDIETLHNLENETSQTDIAVLSLQDLWNQTDNKLNNFSSSMQQLNATLQSIILDISGLNNSDLTKEIHLYQKKLEAEMNNLARIDGFLLNENKALNDADNDISELKSILANVSKTIPNLKAKIETGSNILERVKEENLKIAENLSEINTALPNVSSAVSNLRLNLKRIHANVKQQQIKEYIKNQLPDLWESYDLVNSSLHFQERLLLNLESDVDELQNRTNQTENRMNTYPSLNISLGSFWTKSKNLTDKIKQIREKHIELDDIFSKIGLSLINKSVSNQTIEEVKDHFSKKRKRLTDLHKQLDNLTIPLDNINKSTQIYNKDLNVYNNSMDVFDSLQNRLTEMRTSYERFEINNKDISEKLGNNSKTIDNLKDNILDIQFTYSNIDDLVLHQTRERLNENLLKENKTYMRLEEEFGRARRKYLQQQNLLSDNKNLLHMPVDSLDDLNDHLKFVANSTQDLLNQIPPLRLEYNTVNQSVDNQSLVLSQINDLMEALSSRFRIKEKQVYVNAILPELKQLYQNVKEHLNQTRESLHNEYLITLQTEDFLKNVIDLISNKPLLNVSTSPIQQLMQNIKDVLDKNENSHYKAGRAFAHLNTSLMQLEDFSFFPVEELRTEFARLNASLKNIKSNLSAIDEAVSVTEDDSKSVQNMLNTALNAVKKYMELKTNAESVDKAVFLVDSVIHDSKSTFFNVETIMNNQISELNELLSGKTNLSQQLQNEIARFANKTDIISVQLPLIQNKFKAAIVNPSYRNKVMFKEAVDFLNSTVTTFHNLEITNELVDKILNNVSHEASNMQKEADFYVQEGRHMLDLLQQSNNTLATVKKLLKLEEKERFIGDSFPDYRRRYTNLNLSFDAVMKALNLNNASLITLTNQIAHTDMKTDNLTSINTLTGPITEMTESIRKDFKKLYSNITATADVYNSLNLSKLNDNTLFQNDEISITYLEDLYSEYNTSFKTLEETVQSVLNSSSLLIKPAIKETENDLNKLNDILLSFTKSEKQLISVAKGIQDAQKNKSEILELVIKADNDLRSLNNSLFQLLIDYKDFVDNISLEERMISDTNTKIGILRSKLFDASKTLTDIKTEHQITTSSLYTKINDMEVLNKTVFDVDERLVKTRDNILSLTDTLTKIRNDIPQIETNLSAISHNVKSMELMLSSQQNKSKIFRDTKPLIDQLLSSSLKALMRTNISLEQAMKRGHSTKDIITLLKQRLSNIPSINITLNGVSANLSNIMHKLHIMTNEFNDIEEVAFLLQNEVKSFNVLNPNLTVDDVETQYAEFSKSLKDINDSLDDIFDKANAFGPHFSDMVTFLATIDKELDIFEGQKIEINKTGENLQTVGDSLSSSRNSIENLKTNVLEFNDSFVSLLEKYSDVIDATLDNNTKVRSKILEVKNYLKEATNNFAGLSKMYLDAESTLNKINGTLHKDIDTYRSLNKTLNEVTEKNLELREYLDDIQYAIWNQTNDTSVYNVSLNNLPKLLSNIKELLDIEQKEKYISDVVPKFESQYNSLNISIYDTFEKLNFSTALLKALENRFNFLNSTIKNFSTITIPTNPLQKNINDFNETLAKLYLDVTAALTEYGDIDPSALSDKDFIKNKTITLKVLEQRFEKSDKIFKEINKKLDLIETDNKILSSNMSDVLDDLNVILQILESFGDVKDKLMVMSENIHTAKNDKSKADLLLQGILNELRTINSSMLLTKNNYSDFYYNSSREEQMITALNGVIMNLKYRLSDMSLYLSQIQGMHKENQNKFYEVVDSHNTLNSTLAIVKDQLRNTEMDVKNFTLSLRKILDDMPDVQINISKIHTAITDMKDYLGNLKNKADFVQEAKPALQKRLENTTSAFQYTNLSLELMRQQIQELENHVDSVKQRLDGLPTVNISLTDIDSNITEMENRLIIMQDYYNNVQEVLSHLNGNIDSFNVLKENLTVGNVEDKYEMFNHTLDDVNSVLGKIGREFDSFGSQFTNINNTLGNIDDAIGRFEEKAQKIKVLEEDIQNFGSSLNETNRNIDNMLSVTRRLNESFWSLKQNYTDVINRTEEKNSNIEQKINDIDKYLKGAKSIIDNVEKLYFASRSNFTMVNQSLFKDIYTYEDLNSTLKDVKQAYSIIRSKLKDMQNIIANKSSETSKFNSTLTGVSGILGELKLILDEEQKDQEKLNFINSHMHELKTQFSSLQQPLKGSKLSIEKQTKEIGDVHIMAKKTGNRLKRFRTIDITTDLEQKQTKDLKSVMAGLKSNLSDTNDTFIQIRDLMNSLDDRSVPLEDIKSKFQSVNATINGLKSALRGINERLVSARNDSTLTKDALLKLQSSMDMFKALQKQAARVRNAVKLLNSRSSVLATDLGNTGNILERLENTVKAMDLMQTILNDSSYSAFKPKANSDLAKYKKDHLKLDRTATEIDNKLENANTILANLTKSLKKMMTRATIDQGMKELQEQLKNTSYIIGELETPIQITNTKSKALLAEVQVFDTQVQQMKDTLAQELEKYQYVKDKLPLIQDKHHIVNESLDKSRTPIVNLRGKLMHMKEVISKIKEKMKLFGVEDTDGSVAEWDRNITEIETYVTQITKEFKENEITINSLKKKLWKDIKAMYTKDDTLDNLKFRFDGFNQTLNGIDLSVQDILMDLEDLDVTSNEMAQDLVDRNAILTTTPPTTTPSGIPDWLTFNSSGGGVIDRDSATLKCNVDDMSLWEMMKIEKLKDDGNRVVIAAWKLGVGVRKTVRDRRIKVRKVEDAVSGSLIVTIDRLRCEDQATYFCAINTFHMWPVETSIAVSSLPEDSLTANFPTEVFEDKTATFSCTGYPGYPDGQITWRIKHQNDTDYRDFDFYSQISNVSDEDCRRKEINNVPFQFDMSWNNTNVRCYIENTDYYAEGQIRLLPYDICNNVRYLGTIGHPYTPHKYIVCGKELNIMQCPGNTCYDDAEHNCVQCKADHRKGDPCVGQPLYSYVAHETDCKKYYICMGPTKSTKKCTRGYFSPRVPGYCVLAYSQSECARNQKGRR